MRVEELASHIANLTEPVLNYLDHDSFASEQGVRDRLLIEAILALGAEVNMLRIALNTNSIDLEECINRVADKADTVVNSLDSIADKLETIDVYLHQQNGD